MVASSHPPLTDVMTERPCELLHIDLVGPARVRSASGKWYVLVVVDDYSRYAWVFFLEDKGETFGFVRDLVLRLRNERHGDAIRVIRSDIGSEFRNSRLKPFP
jgi:transposase InsO family protein